MDHVNAIQFPPGVSPDDLPRSFSLQDKFIIGSQTFIFEEVPLFDFLLFENGVKSIKKSFRIRLFIE